VSAPLALCLSPHLDDAAFSCGGTLARLAACGWSVHVATVFTASVAAPAGFALACQTDKGLAPDVDYMALRRAEDVVAMRALGATAHWGALREAPHRGYHAAPELFAGAHVADRNTWSDVVAALGPLVAALRPALLLAPQGLGGHVDHRHVVRAVRALAAPVADAAPTPVAWYRDTPYVLRDPGATPPTVPDDGAARPARRLVRAARRRGALGAPRRVRGVRVAARLPVRWRGHDARRAPRPRRGRGRRDGLRRSRAPRRATSRGRSAAGRRRRGAPTGHCGTPRTRAVGYGSAEYDSDRFRSCWAVSDLPPGRSRGRCRGGCPGALGPASAVLS
jgi:LmbE family N-acetylglucosaminyl deacetylase